MPAIAHDPHDGDQKTPGTLPGEMPLRSDESVVGLELSDVSVVLVEGQPVVVPLPRSVALAAGFDTVEVDDELLFDLGVRRPTADPVPEPLNETDAGSAASALPSSSVAAVPVSTSPLIQIPHVEVPVGAALPVVDKLARPAAAPLSPSAPLLLPTSSPTRIDGPDALTEDMFQLEQGSDAGSPARPYAVGAATRHDDVDASSPVWPDVERRYNDRDVTSEPDRLVALDPAAESPTVPIERVPPEPMEASLIAVVEPPLFPAPLFPDSDEGPLFPDEDPASLAVGTSSAVTEGALLPVPELAQLSADLRVVVADQVRRTTSSGFSLRVDDFNLAAGDVVVVRGDERSGKTLLVRLLAGFDAPDTGTLIVAGTSNTLIADEERTVREGASLAFASAAPTLVPDLTVLQNVELALLVQDVDAAEAERAAAVELEALGISSLADRLADSLARSEAVKVGLARALMGEPALVVVDDLTLGLSDGTVSDLLYRILVVAFEGSAVVVTTTDPRVWHALVVERGARAASLEDGLLVFESE